MAPIEITLALDSLAPMQINLLVDSLATTAILNIIIYELALN